MNNDRDEKTQEWFESQEPEVDFNELNKANIINRYSKAPTTNIDTTEIDLTKVFSYLKKEYEGDTQTQQYEQISKQNQNQISTEESLDDENAEKSEDQNCSFAKYFKIKREIELIENDLKSYSEKKNEFKFPYPLETVINELENLKKAANLLENSKEFQTIKKLKEKGIKFNSENINVLNKELNKKADEKLNEKIESIKNLRKHKIFDINSTKFELLFTPDPKKIRIFSKFSEIKKSLDEVQEKIGVWDIKTKKISISEITSNIKNNLCCLDKEYQVELKTKLESLNNKLNEITSDKDVNFYKNTFDKNKINELFHSLKSSTEIEELIQKTIVKLESYSHSHEESAKIFVLLQDIQSGQNRIRIEINDNQNALESLSQNIIENSSLIKNNLNIIQERLKKLKNKK